MRGTALRPFSELNLRRIATLRLVVAAEAIQKVTLPGDGDDVVEQVVLCLNGNAAPQGEVCRGVEPFHGVLGVGDRPGGSGCGVGVLGEIEAGEPAGGAFDGSAHEWVGVAEPAECNHAAGGHAADGEATSVEDAGVGGFGERQHDRIEFPQHLPQDIQGVSGGLEAGVGAIAMAGEIESAGGDAGADPAQVPAGIDFLAGGAAVHPDHGGGGCCPIRVSKECGNLVGAERHRTGTVGECLGELCEPGIHE